MGDGVILNRDLSRVRELDPNAEDQIQEYVAHSWYDYAAGQDGPYEAALRGHKLHDARQPIEILRTIHSFDPCIACAVHAMDPGGAETVKVKVV